MADTILTQIQLEDLFRTLTCSILGIPTKDNEGKEINADKVRIAWPTGGAPDWDINDDLIFIKVTLANDPYARLRDVKYTNGTNDDLNRIAEYTRIHMVSWVLYGPNSYVNSDTLRNGLFDEKITLAKSNLALVTDVPSPMRVPELFNGQWWSRVDLQALFNEKVTRTKSIQYISSVGIQLVTEEGYEQNVNIITQ